MTTVAFDGIVMAADTRVTGSHFGKVDGAQKLHVGYLHDEACARLGLSLVAKRRPALFVAGGHGDFASAMSMARELETGVCGAHIEQGEAGLLVAVAVGGEWVALFEVYPTGAIKLPLVPFAVGSGALAARAAMALGLDAEAAVVLASSFDMNTGPIAVSIGASG
jgi:hypothetical protein